MAAALAAQFPQNLEVLDMQARAQAAAGDQGGAIATYKRAYGVAPGSIQILSRYLRLLIATQDFNTARSVLSSAVERTPGNLALKADMIRIVARIDGVDAGVAQARKYAYNDPVSNIYDLITANLYETAGRNPEAEAVLEKSAGLRRTTRRWRSPSPSSTTAPASRQKRKRC